MRKTDHQPTLFELPARKLDPAQARPEHVQLASKLPPEIVLGGMSWTYAGWVGLVYAPGTSEKLMSSAGLAAYAQHPLMRAVELDRTYYEPLSSLDYEGMAAQVPEHFRFYVKAHEDCVVRRYPLHPRYGGKRGQDNPLFLSADYAERAVIDPLRQGFGEKLGALLFQFPPQDVSAPLAFVDRLHQFLRALPRDVTYAIELRNEELLSREYGQALADVGAIHCHNVWSAMPDVVTQVRRVPPAGRRPLFIRWLMRAGERFEEAEARYKPFSRIVEADTDNREAIAGLVVKAHAHRVPVVVLVDNKAEGCAPESIGLLAHAIVDKLSAV